MIKARDKGHAKRKLTLGYYSEKIDLPFIFCFPEHPAILRGQLEEYEVPKEDEEKITAINEAVLELYQELGDLEWVHALIKAVEPKNVTAEEYFEYLPGAVQDLAEAVRDRRLRIIMAPSWADMIRLIHPSLGDEEVQKMVSDILSGRKNVGRFVRSDGFFLEFALEREKFDHILLERRMKVITEDGIFEGSAEELAERFAPGDYGDAVLELHQAKIGEEVVLWPKRRVRVKDRIRKKKRMIG